MAHIKKKKYSISFSVEMKINIVKYLDGCLLSKLSLIYKIHNCFLIFISVSGYQKIIHH